MPAILSNKKVLSGCGVSSSSGVITDLNEFSPTKLGATFWYDNRAVDFENPSNLPPADGDKVASWIDRSGNDNHLTQSTDANRPTFRAADRSLRFNGTSNQFRRTSYSGPTLGSGSATLFAVVSKRSSPAGTEGLLLAGRIGAAFVNVPSESLVVNFSDAIAAASVSFSDFGVDVMRLFTIIVIDDGETCTFRIRIDGIEKGSISGVSDIGSRDEIALSNVQYGGSPGVWCDIDIKQFLGVARVLSEAELLATERYLLARRSIG